MDEFSELIEAVQDDLTIGDESSLFPLTTVKRAINRAYRKAGSLFLWPETEDAKLTSTIANHEYYDLPQTWRPDSVWRLEIDGVQYGEDPDGSPMHYRDYLEWRNNPDNANSTEKKWSVQNRRYFIYPVPTSDGSNNISIWGQEAVEKLVNDEDVTIFSYSMPDCNEAVVLEAVAILKNKGEEQQSGGMLSVEAKQILLVQWNKIQKAQAKYEKVQPYFDVPDFYGNRNTKNRIGNF